MSSTCEEVQNVCLWSPNYVSGRDRSPASTKCLNIEITLPELLYDERGVRRLGDRAAASSRLDDIRPRPGFDTHKAGFLELELELTPVGHTKWPFLATCMVVDPVPWSPGGAAAMRLANLHRTMTRCRG